MSVMFQATKFKLIELCLDLFFDKIQNGFRKVDGNAIPINSLEKGMFLRRIKYSTDNDYYKNCTILDLEPASSNPHDYYTIRFRFEDTNIKGFEGESPEDYISTVYDRGTEWLYIQ